MLSWLCAVLAALLYGAGTLFQTAGARRVAGLKAVVSPLVIAGYVVDTLAWPASVVALRNLPLFAVEAIQATQVLWVLVGAAWLFKLRPRRVDLGAAVFVVGALALIALSAGAQPAAVPSRTFKITAIVAGLVLAAVFLVWRRRLPPVALAVIGGLGYALATISVRGAEAGTSFSLLSLLHQPLLISLALGGVIGTISFVTSLSKGQPGAMTALACVLEVSIPTIVGLVWLGDTILPGWEWAAGLGVLVGLIGAVVLAMGPVGTLQSDAASRKPAG